MTPSPVTMVTDNWKMCMLHTHCSALLKFVCIDSLTILFNAVDISLFKKKKCFTISCHTPGCNSMLGSEESSSSVYSILLFCAVRIQKPQFSFLRAMEADVPSTLAYAHCLPCDRFLGQAQCPRCSPFPSKLPAPLSVLVGAGTAQQGCAEKGSAGFGQGPCRLFKKTENTPSLTSPFLPVSAILLASSMRLCRVYIALFFFSSSFFPNIIPLTIPSGVCFAALPLDCPIWILWEPFPGCFDRQMLCSKGHVDLQALSYINFHCYMTAEMHWSCGLWYLLRKTPDCPGTLLCCRTLSMYLVVGRRSCVLSFSGDHQKWAGLTLRLCSSKLLQIPLAVGSINSHWIGRSWLNYESGIRPSACVSCYSIFISSALKKAWILLLSA